MHLSRLTSLLLVGAAALIGALAGEFAVAAPAAAVSLPPDPPDPEQHYINITRTSGGPDTQFMLTFHYTRQHGDWDVLCAAHDRVTIQWDGRTVGTFAPETEGHSCILLHWMSPPTWGRAPGKHTVKAWSNYWGKPTSSTTYTVVASRPTPGHTTPPAKKPVKQPAKSSATASAAATGTAPSPSATADGVRPVVSFVATPSADAVLVDPRTGSGAGFPDAVFYGIGSGLVLGAAGVFGLFWWRRRPGRLAGPPE